MTIGWPCANLELKGHGPLLAPHTASVSPPDRTPLTCAGQLGNAPLATVGQDSECSEDGRAVGGLSALEGDESDHEEGDHTNQGTGQDGNRENYGSHKEPFQGVHGAHLMGTATHAEHYGGTLARAGVRALADPAAAAEHAPGRDGRLHRASQLPPG